MLIADMACVKLSHTGCIGVCCYRRLGSPVKQGFMPVSLSSMCVF